MRNEKMGDQTETRKYQDMEIQNKVKWSYYYYYMAALRSNELAIVFYSCSFLLQK